MTERILKKDPRCIFFFYNGSESINNLLTLLKLIRWQGLIHSFTTLTDAFLNQLDKYLNR